MLHTIAAGTADTGANQTAYLVQAQQRGFRFEMGEVMAVDRAAKQVLLAPLVVDGAEILPARSLPYDKLVLAAGSRANDRSEEHTSELQSIMHISYAVFCL